MLHSILSYLYGLEHITWGNIHVLFRHCVIKETMNNYVYGFEHVRKETVLLFYYFFDYF